ncbi:MAG TPA: MMPL family transporter, partial [bacterium]|nr:MMPL family transporter [bacterium]
LTVLISVIWTLGLMSLLQVPLAMVSTILPVLLIAIGSAYGIHAINGYYERLLHRAPKQTALVQAMQHVGKAILMAGLTTMVGFGALATSQVSQVRQFGLFTAFGVGSALLLSVMFLPAILMVMKTPGKIDALDDDRSHTFLDKLLMRLARYNLQYKKVVVLSGVVLFVLSIAGIPRLAVETNTLRFFSADSEIRQATGVMNDHFGGSENLSLYLQGDMKDPEVLRRMLAIQEYAEGLDHVGFSVSIADYVAEINKALNDNDPDYRRIPDSREAVAQEILLYNMSGDPSDFEQVVDYEYRQANVSIRIESISSRELGALVENIETYAKEQAGDLLTVELTGSSYLFKVLTDLLVRGQIFSLLASLALVWIIVSLIFRSAAAGGFSIIPLTLTIVLNFGIMGWLGIPLDTATTMLASMAIGIGVDYSIHFLSRYRHEVQDTDDFSRAAVNTSHTTGKAIFFNAAAVTMGFIVLLFSSFQPIQTLGALTAFTMLTASAGALTILPAALSGFRPKFLRNTNHQTQED